jgi:hypothetical protein
MRRTRTIATLAATLGLALWTGPASADQIAAGSDTSWGKAGVSLEDYWTDSATCGHQAAQIDLSGTAPGKALVIASRMSQDITESSAMITAARIGAPEIQWNRAATIMKRALESCLANRGYVKFKLTKGQSHHLKKLELGSLERRRYLYRLASDPAVLRAQATRAS